jgi:hypothetical protein
MGEGRARCPAVPGPGRKLVTNPAGRPEPGPGGGAGPGAAGCLGQRRQRCRCTGRGADRPVRFIGQAGEVHPLGERRQPPLSLAS